MADKVPSKVQIDKWIETYDIGTAFHAKYREAQTTNSRKAAIRAMCGMCMGGSTKGIKDCTSPSCPLYRFRITG